MDLKKWSIAIFSIFIILFFMLALIESEIMTWIWQISLPVLLILQVVVILKSRNQSTKEFPDDYYDHK